MVRLREIPRTATFAWSPGSASPFIATGTRAGAVDADFSNETFLELWDLDLENARAGSEPQPTAKISTEAGFNDIAWAESEDSRRGMIAGAFANGSLDVWDADKLLDGSSDTPISKGSKHSGPIKTLQFNPRHSNLLATGGGKGELYVSDLNNMDNPFRLGNNAARVDDIECLDWNKKLPHILVTGSNAGFVTVWDVKAKKESLTLNNLGRKPVSAVAWDPQNSTKLITSIPLETDPLILVWDLRNSNAPERVLRGHESGVMSLSWCMQDPSLLLSCGQDNRTICWNPQNGEAYGEFPIVTNWTFQTRWNPHNPNLFATASFDGKIAVQTIQNTRQDTADAGNNQNQAVDDEDFFAKAQTQPQASTFSLPKAPKWLERPVAASFGFGGKVVSVTTAPGSRSSKIRISNFEIDSSITDSTDSFETALQTGDLRSICETRMDASETEGEKGDWKVMNTLLSEEPRKQLIRHLGFSGEVDEAADSLSKLGIGKETNGKPESLSPPSNGAKRHKRLTSIFDGNVEADSFLSDLSASKGAKTNNPFHIYTGNESEADRSITRALALGQFDKALDISLQEDRMSDAFMIALCGGQKCIEKAQEAYFLKQAQGPNYVRLLASIVGKDMWDIVHNADLSNWKDAIAVICTFTDDKEFPDLCEALGDRLEENSRSQTGQDGRKDASFCYMVGSKLEKVVGIWIQELHENENEKLQSSTDDSGFSIHVRVLRDFIEKVTVFRRVSRYQDAEQQKTSDWKLSQLYDKYLEYADIVATNGRLDVAEQYLSLLPNTHPEGEVARNRIKLATKKSVPKAAAPRTSSRMPSVPLAQPSGYQIPQQPRGPSPAANLYAPAGITQPANPYAPAAPNIGYAPTGYQAQQQSSIPPPPPSMGPPVQAGIPPPPRGSTQSPSRAANIPAWNDLPDGFARVPTPRRNTPGPSPAVITSPFPNQPAGNQVPPPGPPQGPGAPAQRASVPPPPKGPMAPPPMASPHAGGMGFQAPERPPSTSSAAYTPAAPLHPAGQAMNVPPPAPRGPSPYNAPPTAPPPTNRYAPNPVSQAPAGPGMAPPPQAAAPPPGPSPYAPQQFQPNTAPGPYGPPPTVQGSHPPPPPPTAAAAVQQQSRPSTSQSQQKPQAPPRHPPGDRTHIPSNAQPIFENLSNDMQRVKSRAPSSFKAQVNDTERRLNILFDHLNNEELLSANTVESMVELSRAIQVRDYETAQAIHLDILTNRTDECGNWMVGVKRLIGMSKATP